MSKVMNDTSSHGKELAYRVFRKAAKNRGLLVFRSETFQLSIEEVISLRDMVGVGTNAIYRISSALAALRPYLPIFPSRIKWNLARFESSCALEVHTDLHELLVKKDGMQRKFLPFMKMTQPWLMLELINEKSRQDDSFEPSEDWMNEPYRSKVVVTYNIDKGGNDINLSVRLLNRKAGNSMDHTYPIASVGGPVCECHENELQTLFNKKYQIGSFLQALVYDNYFILTRKDTESPCMSLPASSTDSFKTCEIACERLMRKANSLVG
ncbi:hypothetical protein ACHAWF_006639 [Thalassiosira exigua]